MIMVCESCANDRDVPALPLRIRKPRYSVRVTAQLKPQ